MRRSFGKDEEGAVAVDWVILSAAAIGLALAGAVAITAPTLQLSGGFLAGADDNTQPAEPDFVMPARRLPLNPDHPYLWANPFHAGALPDDFPDIGGRPFTISGDGNPRLLVAGADPRVISGDSNPQFDPANYARSGTAFGDGRFHRLLIDTPPPGQTYTVNLVVDGQTFQYSFSNIPY